MTQTRTMLSILALVLSTGAAIAAPRTYTAGTSGPATSTDLDTRLPEAVKRGDKTAVATLLRERVPVNSAEGDGSTALHWAAYQDNLPLARMLIGAHADVNAKTRLEGLTPLFMACQNGDAAMIDLLLTNGADANQVNSLGTTPLMVAASSGSVPAVTALIAHGAQVNAHENVHDQTALMFAAAMDRSDVIRYLIAHGADANLASKVTPSMARIEFSLGGKVIDKTDAKPEKEEASEKPESVKAEKADAKADTKADIATGNATDAATKKPRRDRGSKSMGGMTPLLYAARQGNIAATTALLDGGADINKPSGSEQTTPLVMAIANGHYDVAKVLVEHGADVNKANMMGLTPLFATIDVQWAPHEWSPEPVVAQENTDYLHLMKLLIAHGANLNARLDRMPWFRTMSENRVWTDISGATAYWRAAWADDLAAMQLLKDAGADITIPTNIGTTPMMAAAGIGWSANYSTSAPTRIEAVEFCLKNGASVTHQDDLGFTALHGAGFVGDLKLIQYLVDKGAKTDVKTKAGDYPADSANGPFEKSLPNPEAVALLEKLGSPNSHNCRSSDCVPPVKEDKPVQTAKADKKPDAAAPAAADGKKPAGNQ